MPSTKRTTGDASDGRVSGLDFIAKHLEMSISKQGHNSPGKLDESLLVKSIANSVLFYPNVVVGGGLNLGVIERQVRR